MKFPSGFDFSAISGGDFRPAARGLAEAVLSPASRLAPVAQLRRRGARARTQLRRFLAGRRVGVYPRRSSRSEGNQMKLSTRNQLPGTVVSVAQGEAMAVVKVRLDGGQVLTSSITRDAAEDLGLGEGL